MSSCAASVISSQLGVNGLSSISLNISGGGGGGLFEWGLFNKIDFSGGGLNGRGGYSDEGAYSVIYGISHLPNMFQPSLKGEVRKILIICMLNMF